MRTDIHTTVANYVLGKGTCRFVTVGADDLRTYRYPCLRLDERHHLQAIASPRAAKRCLRPAPAGAIRMLGRLCPGTHTAGSRCLRPLRPESPQPSGHLG